MKAKTCCKCGASTYKKEYIEVIGLRICMECVRKKAEEIKPKEA